MTHFWLRVLRSFGSLPLPVTRALGAALGALLYLVAADRRRVARINLRACFPQMPEHERRALSRAHFRAFAQSVLDRGLIWWGSRKRIEQHVRWIDLHHFEEAAAQGPVIVLAPHFVGLDAGGIRFSMLMRAISMYSHQKNKVLDDAILAARSRFNKPILLSRQDGMRVAIRAMRRGLSFYYLPDMDFGARDAAFVPFFGVSAATITAPARLARITQARVVPCVTRMTPGGYEARFYPAWTDFPDRGDEGPTALGPATLAPTTLAHAARRMNAFIEERVREMPEQYLWTHKRFKTRPPGEAKFYR
ncbi:MAG: lipid A biosynthesis acyltransferase [Burkholderiaceae bacterium]